MNKQRLFLSTLTIFILVISAVSAQDAQQITFNKISDRLYEISGAMPNCGVYIGDTGVLLIDSIMNEQPNRKMLDGIKKLTDKPILYLVNTHADGDHINGNLFMPETVTFIAHENCRKEFLLPGRNNAPSQWSNLENAPFVPSVTFRHKMDLHLGSPKVEFWYFGVGHTTGDIVVYFPEEKTAFIGDQIFVGRPQLIHSYKGGNSFGHVKALAKMLDTLDAEHFCSGHSEIVDRTTILNHIAAMKKRQEKVKTLRAQNKSLDEIKAEFESNEANLIESIYNELADSSQ